MNWLTDILPWFFWLTGGLGTIGAIAFILLVPGGLTLLVEFFRPWFKLAGEATAAFLRNRWEGLVDIFDNFKTVITAACIAAIAFTAGYYVKASNTKDVADSVRIEYKLVKRTPAEKKAYLQSKGYSTVYTWWRTWF